MSWQDFFLICFVVGFAWSMVSLLMGGLHLHLPKLHIHGSHAARFDVGLAHNHGHPGFKTASVANSSPGAPFLSGVLEFFSGLMNPSAIAIFLAWFGGAGYLLTRHALLAFWLVLVLSVVTGLAGASLIVYLMLYLQSRERPMDPADYEMVGVLGQIASPVRQGGTGEMIFTRDGAKRAAPVRSANGLDMARGVEVIVTRFERGIAYVRTWDEMSEQAGRQRSSSAES